VKRPSLKLVFRIPNDCQPVSEIQRDMAAFAALLVHPALKPDAVTADSCQRTVLDEELDLIGTLVAKIARVFRRDVFAFLLKRGGRRIRVGILNPYRIAKVQRPIDLFSFLEGEV
jgi:hypothetical protein